MVGTEPIVSKLASAPSYRPLPSVWDGDDSELLDRMLRFYPHKLPERVLDATANERRFWRGKGWPVIALDLNPAYRPDVLGDCTCLPFSNSSFDVVVYDPPHIPNQGQDRTKDFQERFGLRLKSSKETGYNLSFMYLPFVKEASRVLRPDGVLLCKVTDYVHNHRLQWAHIDLIQAAVTVGLCPCDCIVKIRQGPIIDPKWKMAHHARRHHCYWIVFRKSNKCE